MDAAEKKKPGLALVISMGKGKHDEPDEDDSGGDDGAYGASVDELADTLGVADDKKQDFADAFKAAVMSCTK